MRFDSSYACGKKSDAVHLFETVLCLLTYEKRRNRTLDIACCSRTIDRINSRSGENGACEADQEASELAIVILTRKLHRSHQFIEKEVIVYL